MLGHFPKDKQLQVAKPELTLRYALPSSGTVGSATWQLLQMLELCLLAKTMTNYFLFLRCKLILSTVNLFYNKPLKADFFFTLPILFNMTPQKK